MLNAAKANSWGKVGEFERAILTLSLFIAGWRFLASFQFSGAVFALNFFAWGAFFAALAATLFLTEKAAKIALALAAAIAANALGSLAFAFASFDPQFADETNAYSLTALFLLLSACCAALYKILPRKRDDFPERRRRKWIK